MRSIVWLSNYTHPTELWLVMNDRPKCIAISTQIWVKVARIVEVNMTKEDITDVDVKLLMSRLKRTSDTIAE